MSKKPAAVSLSILITLILVFLVHAVISEPVPAGSSVAGAGSTNEYVTAGNTAEYTISVTAGAGGYISTSSPGSNETTENLQVRSGNSTAITFDASPGYKLSSITIDAGGFGGFNPETYVFANNTSQTYTFNAVTANHSINATFSTLSAGSSNELSTPLPPGTGQTCISNIYVQNLGGGATFIGATIALGTHYARTDFFSMAGSIQLAGHTHVYYDDKIIDAFSSTDGSQVDATTSVANAQIDFDLSNCSNGTIAPVARFSSSPATGRYCAPTGTRGCATNGGGVSVAPGSYECLLPGGVNKYHQPVNNEYLYNPNTTTKSFIGQVRPGGLQTACPS